MYEKSYKTREDIARDNRLDEKAATMAVEKLKAKGMTDPRLGKLNGTIEEYDAIKAYDDLVMAETRSLKTILKFENDFPKPVKPFSKCGDIGMRWHG